MATEAKPKSRASNACVEAVLAVLNQQPVRWWYRKDICTAAGWATWSVSHALRQLAEDGRATVRHSGHGVEAHTLAVPNADELEVLRAKLAATEIALGRARARLRQYTRRRK